MRDSVCALAGITSPRMLLADNPPLRLVAAKTMVDLVASQGPKTAVFAYNQVVPGPLLRYRREDRLKIEFENQLDEPTTVHWHGLRVPVEMDGVPYLSQPPIEPGESFTYVFDLEDAGTFWYHPHVNSSEQVGKGLHGVLIVDEDEPPEVDRDVVWVLDDWRLDREAKIAPFGENLRDASHNGRIGNVVTVNGSIKEEFAVDAGERIRLRLVNVANARTFSLIFKGLNPWIIALDGHPIKPHQRGEGPITIASGQRVDLIVDISGQPGDTSLVIDNAYGSQFAYELMRLVRHDEVRLSARNRSAPQELPANPVARAHFGDAEQHQIVFEGGAMGGLSGAYLNGEYKSMRDLAGLGKLWSMNGQIPMDVHQDPPFLRLQLGKSYRLQLINRTAFEHPIHLHGHVLEVISSNGQAPTHATLRDTVLIQPQESMEVAFVADNPGQWMFHCHVLEHQKSGMTAVFSVS